MQSTAIIAIASLNDRFKRSLTDRGNHDSLDLQSSSFVSPQLSTVVIDSREAQRNRSCAPYDDLILDPILDPMPFCGMLPDLSDQWRDRNRNRPVTFRFYVLPPDRQDGAAATVLPPPHAAFVNFPPPIFAQPLPPLPSVSVPYLMPLSTPQSSPSTAAEIVWDASNQNTLLKAASRQRFTEVSGTKIRAFFADAELFPPMCSRL